MKKYKRDGLAGLVGSGRKSAGMICKDTLTAYLPFLHKMFYRKPSSVLVEPTNDCNLGCVMCYRGKRKIGYMDFGLFTKVVDDLASIGDVRLGLCVGGEPLLHPQISNMLEYAMANRNRFSEVSLITNGMLLSKVVADTIVKLNVDRVTVSLDGVGDVTERIRRGSDYRIVEENLDLSIPR